jgi:hypothetical protein
MDPGTLVTLAVPTALDIGKLLAERFKRLVAAEARWILQTEGDARPRVRSLFDDTKQRLRTTWSIGIAMTVILFTLFVGMTIAAVVTGLTTGKAAYSIVFGGIGAASLLTVVLWKPYDKAFQAAITTQRLEMILVGLEEEWSSCSKVGDGERQAACIRAANKAALEEIAKLS